MKIIAEDFIGYKAFREFTPNEIKMRNSLFASAEVCTCLCTSYFLMCGYNPFYCVINKMFFIITFFILIYVLRCIIKIITEEKKKPIFDKKRNFILYVSYFPFQLLVSIGLSFFSVNYTVLPDTNTPTIETDFGLWITFLILLSFVSLLLQNNFVSEPLRKKARALKETSQQEGETNQSLSEFFH